ncbi:MAG TPA: cytochrome c3 family protein [Polyangiaceae bacterium]|nr:cytochrome c3 family protein [Polyangiaceae bacterium]
MRTSRIQVVWLGVSLLIAAGLAALSGDRALARAGGVVAPAKQVSSSVGGGSSPSELIFPARTIPIRFDHAAHHQRGATCLHCHPSAKTSDSTAKRVGWSVAACDRCHGTNHRDLTAEQPTECAFCHEGYEANEANRVRRSVVPSARLHFNHRVHAARNIGCAQCHGAVQTVGKTSRDHLPRMQKCLTCHGLPDGSRGDAKAGCPTCHLTTASGRLQTSFPSGKLLPPRWMGAVEHGPDFVHTHAVVAANDSRFCARCHSEADCLRCHDGRERPRQVHPNDYLSMHAVAAKQSAQRCNSCHHHESFCKNCHLRAGVTLTGPGWNRAHRGRVHPPAAIFVSTPITGRHHSVEARRNLPACVGCHGERDCVGCHATRGGGGIGVNPHPAGFSSRCASALARNPRPCFVCHDPDDALIFRCR